MAHTPSPPHKVFTNVNGTIYKPLTVVHKHHPFVMMARYRLWLRGMKGFAACFGRQFLRKLTPPITWLVFLGLLSLLISNKVPNPLHNSLHNSPHASPQVLGGRWDHCQQVNTSITAAFVTATLLTLLTVNEDASDYFAQCAPSHKKNLNTKGENKGKHAQCRR